MLRPVVGLSIALIITPLAGADALTDAAEGLCQRVKTCAVHELAEEELTPEVREMMEPMLNNMCANMRSRIGDVPESSELYDPAIACMRSMEALTCTQMKDPVALETDDCKSFREKADAQTVQDS